MPRSNTKFMHDRLVKIKKVYDFLVFDRLQQMISSGKMNLRYIVLHDHVYLTGKIKKVY